MATTKRKKAPDKEGLALLEAIQRKIEGTTEEEVLAALAADKKLRAGRRAPSKESKPRRASA
jgi:hypothetical protein